MMQSSLTKGTPPGVAARIAAVVAGIGLAVELLLRVGPWGVSLPMALALVAAATWWFSPPELRTQRGVLLGAAVALSLVFAWRDLSLLIVGATLAILATGLGVAMPVRGWLRRLDPADGLSWGVDTLVGTGFGAVPLVGVEVPWRRLGSERAPGLSEGMRGALLALPLLVPFALLFLSADAAFAAIVRRVIDLPELASHLFLWAVFAWLIAGYVRRNALARAEPAPPSTLRLTGAEAAAGLTVLLVLFVAFVAVQLRYFFGGADVVESVTGLTYAEYARHGFFELVAVAALLLLVLVTADWLTRDATPRGRGRVRLVALGLLAMLAVILVSALQRMRLYVNEFGLTQLRFFTTAFMLWLVVVFAWYALTVLRERRTAFAGGLYVSGMVAVFVLALADPIGWIARTNLDRAVAGAELDTAHLRELEGDAVPVVVEALPSLAPDVRCAIARDLTKRWSGPSEGGWRTWNVSRSRARSLVRAHEAEWRRACPDISENPNGRDS